MNETPRVTNRVLLAIIGLLLLAVGATGIALAVSPQFVNWWTATAGSWKQSLDDGVERTLIPGSSGSWIWAVVAVILVVVIILAGSWLAQQGKGRGDELLLDEDGGETPGDVRIGGGVAEQAMRAALAERTDLVGASVTTYRIKGTPALKVRLSPRQGVAPQRLAAEVSQLATALDAVVGHKTPVLIHIGSGTRARFTRAERVR
ncbi:hypothetical protein ACQR35_08780 [Pseudarthrobacter sp. J1738]|uniref:hypothetical protein n=1 Tax=unclassified Pseudarthrobacter TaxID=2647000 RepID=UPI003D2C0E18